MSIEDLVIITYETDLARIPFHEITDYLANEMDDSEDAEHTPPHLMEIIATYWELVFDHKIVFERAIVREGPEGWVRANKQ